MAGKGYESVDAGRHLNFGGLWDLMQEYYSGSITADGLHDLVNQLTGMVQTFVDEIDDRQFNQGYAYEALAYATLAVEFLRQFQKSGDSEVAARRADLAIAWEGLMSKLERKGLEPMIPFPA